MTEEPDIVERLRNYNTCSDTDVDEAADEIERLRKERDEARRECCHLWKEYFYFYKERDHYTPQKLAEEHGWDCFKENTNG
jgi:hypothetical protein